MAYFCREMIKMKTVNKNELLAKLTLMVERHLDEATFKFKPNATAILTAPASNGGWSIVQCLEHLNTYGNYYLPRIEKGLHSFSGQPTDTFKSSWLGMYFTNMMDVSKGTKKYKAARLHVPVPLLDAQVVLAEFVRQQQALLGYLRLAANVDLNAIKIPISIAKLINLKLGDVLQFMVMHNERHLQQASRNL